jgi:aerobic carbon-monoxide dehydrogenase medium subunit
MSFDLHRPATVAEAIELAQRLSSAARYIAGGTDTVIQINRKKIHPAHLIDVACLPGISGITETADGFTLGALTNYRAIETHAAFRGGLRALIEAASVVGGRQVRNIATIGGNIVNASPAADFVPALLVLDAALEIAGPNGSRTVALGDFIVGPGKTSLAPAEIVTRIRFANLPANSTTAFLKEGRRRAMEISVVCVAACLTLDADGSRCASVRLAIGAAGPKAFRPEKAEAYLAGKPAGQASFAAAGQLAAEASSPISDVRASADYRRRLVAIMVERALTTCFERIAEERR